MQSNGSDSQQLQQEQNKVQQQPPPPPPPPQQHQQWMAMQYPAAAMVMQHQMMPPQHYAPPPPQHYMAAYHQYHQHHPHLQQPPQQHHQNQGSSGENKTIWIGDLHHWMDENYLHTCFASTGEIASIKVIRNKQTGLSEGYGFVEFFTHAAAEKVLQNYTGILMPNTEQPFRLNWATFSSGGYASNGASGQGFQSDGDSTNTTIFVGGLDPNVTDEDLKHPFSQYGEIVSVKIPVGKGCGFVQFGNRSNAEEALQKLNGTVIGKQTVRLSWGRNPANKQFRSDFGNQWSGAYYGGQVYDGYGYALPPPHDPSLYAATAAAYAAYPVYGSHQQQVS
uniref:RRM domain-containing protein n=1 Tax=Manihot esculenta TaxID=3983 RepID=A0A2C9VZJ3_MANES